MQSTSSRPRPTGVAIIGILDIISGAIMLVLGLIAIGTIMIPYLHIPGMHRLHRRTNHRPSKKIGNIAFS